MNYLYVRAKLIFGKLFLSSLHNYSFHSFQKYMMKKVNICFLKNDLRLSYKK